MVDINSNKIVKVGQLQTVAERVKFELDALDSKKNYTAANMGISVAGNSIGIQLSAADNNILSIANDGLKSELKLSGATKGNFAAFGTSGAIVDSGISMAADSEVSLMLASLFSTAGNSSHYHFDDALTYDDFTGATVSEGGLSGHVPAPAAGDQEKFLRGDGSWAIVSTEQYTLPTASSVTKGGVIIGAGLSMAGDTLNCTISAGTLDLASADSQGLLSPVDKVKLDGIASGAQVNLIESVIIDGSTQLIQNKAVELNLDDYAKKSDISGVYRYKGTVPSLASLSAFGNEVGDAYNIINGGGVDAQGVEIKAGDNVAWNGSGWDALAGIVDLSNFVVKDGSKVLSSNDFTDAYKNKLDSLGGYTLPTASSSTKGGVKVGTGLSMNGDTLNCTISGGGNIPVATSSSNGLMSASDKQRLDSLFLDSTNFADAVISGVGGLFLPSVSSPADYVNFKDSNVQFFDSKLQRLCNDTPCKTNAVNSNDGMAFCNGQTTVKTTYNDLKCSLTSTLYDGAQSSLPSHTSTYTYFRDLYKISETKGFIMEYYKSDSGAFYSKINRYAFIVKDSGQISLSSSASILSGGSASTDLYCYPIQSLETPHTFAFWESKKTVSSGNENYSIFGSAYYDDGKNTHTGMGSESSIGIYYGDYPSSKTDISEGIYGYLNNFYKPKFAYSNGSITVTRATKTQSRCTFHNVFVIREDDYNSSKTVTDKRWYLWCIHGSGATPCWAKKLIQSWNNSSGYTYNITGFDAELDIIIHAYPDRTRTNWYLITFRTGTYSYSSTWLNQCFKAWHFDPKTCDVQPCSKTFMQVLPDLII